MLQLFADHIRFFMNVSRGASAVLGVVLLAVTGVAAQSDEKCEAPDAVCAARSAVFGISAFDPVGSAVRIGPNLLVTNRHIVADRTEVKIILPDGKSVMGDVVPSSFLGDLILVRAKLPDGNALEIGEDKSGDLWSLGQDISEKRIKVYPKGKLLLPPAQGKPYARLHHAAYSQPGNSGGALVNAVGKLVGVTASGGAGRFEAVPASQISDLRAQSGPGQKEKSASIGKNLRECTLMLEKAQRMGSSLPEKFANVVKASCDASQNRQLYDLAGQLLGRHRKLDDAAKFFERSIEKDPNAINSRLGLVLTLRFARRLEDAKPHVKWLLEVIPDERSIHPVALHVGKATKDQAMIDKALGLIEKHAPNQLEAARNFLKSPAR